MEQTSKINVQETESLNEPLEEHNGLFSHEVFDDDLELGEDLENLPI